MEVKDADSTRQSRFQRSTGVKFISIRDKMALVAPFLTKNPIFLAKTGQYGLYFRASGP